MKKLITAGCVLTLCGLLALLGFYGYAYLSYVPLLGQDSRIRLYNNQGGLIYESTYQKNSEWINLEEVPQTMIDAVISIEDRRFYQHYGLDPIRIANAVLVNAENGDIVVALIDDSATVKRFYKMKDYIKLQPENDTMDPIIVPDCRIMGKVFGVLRLWKN